MHINALASFLIAINSWSYVVNAFVVRAGAPECWEDHAKFRPLVFKDCIDVINQEITRGYDPDIPLKFSPDPSLHPDIGLPKYWRGPGARCGIGVDFGHVLKGYDRTTLNDIKKAARAVAVECVIKPPHIGGYIQLGWADKLGVLIAGKSPQPNEFNETSVSEA
ncbi:MAG: hypothetical protein Q9220_000690 [cf. Caloplaca sp. 1 TL-2023]